MQNPIVRIVMFLISCLLLVISVLSLVKDAVYFTTRTEITGQVISIDDPGVGQPYIVSVRYFNRYLAEEVTCNTSVKKSGVRIKEIDGKSVQVYYARYMPCDIFLEGFNAPRYAKLLIDTIVVASFTLGVYALLRPAKNQKEITEFKSHFIIMNRDKIIIGYYFS